MRRFALIIGVVIVAAAVALVMAIVKPFAPRTNTNNGSLNRILSDLNRTTNVPATNTALSEKEERDQILGISRLFAERYGSTFSDNPTAHLTSVLDASSTALKEALKKTISRPTPVLDATSVARSFSVTSLDLKRGAADVTVTVQRTEKAANQGASKSSFIQTLTLSLVREKEWKVSVAVWGPKR